MSQTEMQQDSWHSTLSVNQQKALSLLGQGVSAVMVASTLGVTESLVSQYLSDARFADEVVKRKLATLQKQTEIDDKYIEIEDKLLDRMKKVLPLMSKPMDILRGIQVINATKRRGMADSPVGLASSTIVQINLPGAVAARFISNTHNQIIEVQDNEGSRSLVTASPQAVERLARESKERGDYASGDTIEAVKLSESFSPTGTNGSSALSAIPGWEASISDSDILRQASERIQESGISETVPKGLRRSFEIKGAITADDL